MQPYNTDDQSPSEPDQAPPRCARCFYRLDSLGVTNICPECGKAFDLFNESTFVCKPPFLFWTFWLPGIGLSFMTAIFWMLLFGLFGSIGVGVTVATPFAAGVILAYGVRWSKILLTLAALLVISMAVGAIMAMHPSAAICIFILGILSLCPLSCGLFVGILLQAWLKSKKDFPQRHWFPILLLMLLPGIVEFLERTFISPPPEESVTTSVVLPMSAVQAFDQWIFYEDVQREPPFLLRMGLPIPVKTVGNVTKPGDIKVCLYKNGRLVKRITAYEPGKRIAFDVIEQWHVQDHAIRLTSGSFEFTPTPDGKCQVTLSTRYEPLMTPRLAWRPAETLIAHELHEHVLLGMQDSKPRPDRPTPEGAPL
jgi:hypothetical protein